MHIKLRVNFQHARYTVTRTAQTAARSILRRADQFYFFNISYRGHPVAASRRQKKKVSANQSACRYQILISRSVCVRTAAASPIVKLSILWTEQIFYHFRSPPPLSLAHLRTGKSVQETADSLKKLAISFSLAVSIASHKHVICTR